MCAVKNTYKTAQLLRLFQNNTMFAGIDLHAEEMTNLIAEKIANSKGYYWSRKEHVWQFKPIATAKSYADLQERQGYTGEGTRALLVRVMAEHEHIRSKIADITLGLELAGYRIVNVSQPVRNRDNGTWFRVYITAERV